MIDIMISDYLFSIVSAIFFIVCISYSVFCKKMKSIILAVASGIFSLIEFLLFIVEMQFIPIFKNIILLVLILANICIFIQSSKIIESKSVKHKITVGVLVGFLVFSFLFFTFGENSILIKEQNEKKYVGIYDGATGISETWVYYYEYKTPLLISSKCIFSECHGIYFGNPKDLINNEPFDTTYFS